MRLYLDSSALVKVFVEEEGRSEVLDALEEAEVAATSRIAYVECRAAFARAMRAGRLSEDDEQGAVRAFEQRWKQLAVVEFDDALMREAATLSRTHALRAADAIHLASATLFAGIRINETSFACWDTELRQAAVSAGFASIEPAHQLQEDDPNDT